MALYALRHGKTRANEEGLLVGRQPIPLTSKGAQDIENLAMRLRPYPIQRIIASDLPRASETAEILARQLGVPITYDARLREVDFGDLTGKDKQRARQTHPGFKQFSDYLPPKGESYSELQRRLSSFISELTHDDETLLVTHSGCIRMLYALFNNIRISEALKIDTIPHDHLLICEPCQANFTSLSDSTAPT